MCPCWLFGRQHNLSNQVHESKADLGPHRWLANSIIGHHDDWSNSAWFQSKARVLALALLMRVHVLAEVMKMQKLVFRLRVS